MKLSLVVAALASLSAAPVWAADKASVSLECGGAKATITCTKFDGDSCVASKLEFDTPAGKHVVSPERKDIKQVFDRPIIADTIACDFTKKHQAFAIFYSPGCDYSECLTVNTFRIDGNMLRVRNGGELKYLFGDEANFMQQSPSVSLRSDRK